MRSGRSEFRTIKLLRFHTVKAVLKSERPAKHPRNIAGPQIQRWRQKRGMTQPMLVAKLNLLGWGISRETLAKVELRIRWVADAELVCFAKAFGVSLEEMLPDNASSAMRSFFKAQPQ
jgi:transcriptional regulator with XRE-family HTH domain